MYVIKFIYGDYFAVDYSGSSRTQLRALRFDNTDRANMTDLAAKLGGRWIKLVPKSNRMSMYEASGGLLLD